MTSREAVLDLDRMERLHIQSVLGRFGGDTRRASEALGISLATLYRKLKKINGEEP